MPDLNDAYATIVVWEAKRDETNGFMKNNRATRPIASFRFWFQSTRNTISTRMPHRSENISQNSMSLSSSSKPTKRAVLVVPHYKKTVNCGGYESDSDREFSEHSDRLRLKCGTSKHQSSHTSRWFGSKRQRTQNETETIDDPMVCSFLTLQLVLTSAKRILLVCRKKMRMNSQMPQYP